MRALVLWLAALATTAPVFAQSSAPNAPAETSKGVPLDQFVNRRTTQIMAADTDGDGRVSRVEIQAVAQGKRDPGKMFDHMDVNKDGYLDKDEIRDALTARFHHMDRNGDGVLSPDDRLHAKASQGQTSA